MCGAIENASKAQSRLKTSGSELAMEAGLFGKLGVKLQTIRGVGDRSYQTQSAKIGHRGSQEGKIKVISVTQYAGIESQLDHGCAPRCMREEELTQRVYDPRRFRHAISRTNKPKTGEHTITSRTRALSTK